MNKFRAVFSSVFLMSSFICISAQMRYHDASQFPVYGKATEMTEKRYERLPADLKGRIRDELWDLGTNSTGLYIKFRSNTSAVTVKWHSTYKNWAPHMADTGTRGLDLYTQGKKGWEFIGTAFPSGEKDSEATLVASLKPEEREFILYLSLYDEVEDLQIGVDEGAFIENSLTDSPKAGRPIVFYGTSILQGGCASRPGMAFSNIIGRKLDREVINLGFSGNGRLDLEIAEVMAGIEDPAIFIMDEAPNCSGEMIDANGEAFFRILRDAHPDVPVIFIDNPFYAYYGYNEAMTDYFDKSNDAQGRLFRKLKAQGEKKIWYISGKHTVGTDNEAFVDCIHYTDLGMMRYADFLIPIIRRHMLK